MVSYSDVTSNGSSAPPEVPNPHELALQSLCKQILKARLFRGFYIERRYVEAMGGYRAIVALQRGEKELERLLLDVMEKLQMFYQATPHIWIGVTHGNAMGLPRQPGALPTYIWAQLDGLAFGEYWFSVRNIRFRDNEIAVKLRMVRPFEPDRERTPIRQRAVSTSSKLSMQDGRREDSDALGDGADDSTELGKERDVEEEPAITLQDFIAILQQWRRSIKRTTYDFLANDINRKNIVEVLRFVALLIVSILSGLVVAVRFLGAFILSFMGEFSRLTYVWTPILMKCIDVVAKIIGGFYILVSMIWKDAVVNRGRPKEPLQRNYIGYRRPEYQRLEYHKPDIPQDPNAAYDRRYNQ